PDDLVEPVVTAASFFFCWRAMGAASHPAFPAPSHFLRVDYADSSGISAARSLIHVLSTVMPRFKRGIQYSRGVSIEHDRLWNTGSPGQAGRRHPSHGPRCLKC